MSDRRQKIQQMLNEDPHDKFLRYSLAMDHRGEGEFVDALRIFDSLTADQTPHVPAFFMSAQILVEQDKIDAAREKLRVGIDHARAQDDSHAAAEMSELLASLGEMGEL